MTAIAGAELQIDRLISADPGNGVVAALDSSGAAVNLIAYGQGTGDVTYSAPTGNTTNTRRHLFDRPILLSGAGQALLFTGQTTGEQHLQFVTTGGNLLSGVESSAGANNFSGSPAYAGFVGTGNATSLVLGTSSVSRVFISATGQVGIGTAMAASAGAGELVLANDKALRGVNTAGNDTIPLIALNALANTVTLGGQTNTIDTGATVRGMYWAAASFPVGGANRNGTFGTDGTNNRFIFYSGGARYYIAGTSF